MKGWAKAFYNKDKVGKNKASDWQVRLPASEMGGIVKYKVIDSGLNT